MLHYVLKKSIKPPFSESLNEIYFGMGCFWGVEKLFWNVPGVWITAVGYSGGSSKNPTYQQICNEETGHAEVVKIIYNSNIINLSKLLDLFWENHDPTQGMRQGNDIGSQYRSIIFVINETDFKVAETSKEKVQKILSKNNFNKITTEIKFLETFYYAEEYHQQYLAKNPNGYCNLKGLNIKL